MMSPFYTRKEIPFFYEKSEKETQQDPYERYDPMVIRQSAIHLADELWDGYPMQAVLQLARPYLLGQKTITSIVEVGCGVGRWIGNLAQTFPNAECWGIDYSYQMLKQAQEVWVNGHSIHLNFSRYGFSAAHKIKGFALNNLHFGLAKASVLPFEDESQDVILNSFLLDRLDDPVKGLKEMKRVLKPKGIMVLVSPLNFSQSKHWDKFYPPIKIHQLLIKLGFKVQKWQEEILIKEPLDCHGNAIQWKCIGLVCQNL